MVWELTGAKVWVTKERVGLGREECFLLIRVIHGSGNNGTYKYRLFYAVKQKKKYV